MPAKKPAKKTVNKSNVAKGSRSSLLNKKLSFNWKIAAVIALVLITALGYLFVRLSRAGSGDLSWNLGAATSTVKYYQGKSATKIDGRAGLGTVLVSGNQFAAAEVPYYTNSDRTSLSYCVDGYAASAAKVGFEYSVYSSGGANSVSVIHVAGSPISITASGNFNRCATVPYADFSGVSNPLVRVRISIVSSGGAGQSYLFRAYTSGLKSVTIVPSISPQPTTTTTTTTQIMCGEGVTAYGIGNQGNCVRLIQQQLVNLGYNIGSKGVDGYYGVDTSNAVKVYQQRAGLTQDGVVGVQTFNHMFGPNPARKQ